MQRKFKRVVKRWRQPARCGGFTLVELLVVAALVASLAAVVTPSFIAWQVRDRVDSAARTFVASLAYARSEAIRRGARVTVCRIDAARRCLASGSACADGITDWSCGWAVMVDSRSGPLPLRAQAHVANVEISGSTLEIGFTPPAGQVIGRFGSLEIAPRAPSPNLRGDAWRRCIRIAAGGRVHLDNGSCTGAA